MGSKIGEAVRYAEQPHQKLVLARCIRGQLTALNLWPEIPRSSRDQIALIRTGIKTVPSAQSASTRFGSSSSAMKSDTKKF